MNIFASEYKLQFCTFTGNDNIHLITHQADYQLKIRMRRFNGDEGEVTYSTFKVDSEDEQYNLTVGGFSGPGNLWGECSLYIDHILNLICLQYNSK